LYPLNQRINGNGAASLLNSLQVFFAIVAVFFMKQSAAGGEPNDFYRYLIFYALFKWMICIHLDLYYNDN